MDTNIPFPKIINISASLKSNRNLYFAKLIFTQNSLKYYLKKITTKMYRDIKKTVLDCNEAICFLIPTYVLIR